MDEAFAAEIFVTILLSTLCYLRSLQDLGSNPEL